MHGKQQTPQQAYRLSQLQASSNLGDPCMESSKHHRRHLGCHHLQDPQCLRTSQRRTTWALRITGGTTWRRTDQTKPVTWQCGTNSRISSSAGGTGRARAKTGGALRCAPPPAHLCPRSSPGPGACVRSASGCGAGAQHSSQKRLSMLGHMCRQGGRAHLLQAMHVVATPCTRMRRAPYQKVKRAGALERAPQRKGTHLPKGWT